MYTRLSGLIIIIALFPNLLISATPTLGQAQPSTSTQQNVNKTSATTQNVANKQAAKPLDVDEDPALIGKRKLNSGLISKMSMSVEKEVALGRQLAAEVDRQAKFIDDPMITEYVNRVAQNLVLHSDAKVPFTVKVIDSDEVNAFALPVASSMSTKD
jgi:predicted Zn-dependent protease